MSTERGTDFSISIAVPTLDRPRDLSELLASMMNQSHPPCEVLIIDDSSGKSAEDIVLSLAPRFRSVSCKLKYVEGRREGLPAARNLAVSISKGNLIAFADDDVLLGKNVFSKLVRFFTKNPQALGVQVAIRSDQRRKPATLYGRMENAILKALMLSYYEQDKLVVRRSAASIFPNPLTRVISAQRLSGCFSCYRHEVFNKMRFDDNLKRYGYMEDLDFTYRVFKRNALSLYAIPDSVIDHKASSKARLQTKLNIYMSTVYWFYVFFKDIFQKSVVNFIAFIWALVGRIVYKVAELALRRPPKKEWWTLIYLISSYFYAFRNVRRIKRRDLQFFNKQLSTES